LPFELAPLSLAFRDGSGRGHRLVVLGPRALATHSELAMVAFFGQRRAGVSAEPLHRADDELIEELRGHSGIVSYSSLELDTSSGANLVLAKDHAALERWQRSGRHAAIAKELAPRHYDAVRIHVGALRGRLAEGSPSPGRASSRSWRREPSGQKERDSSYVAGMLARR
jgi:hypothetical protein